MRNFLAVLALIILGIVLLVILPLSRKRPVSPPSTHKNAPSINTVTLPNAKIGVPYSGDIFTSILGSHENLELSISNLPEGLAIGNCTQRYDSPIIPKPNTIRDCPVTGIPRDAGMYKLSVKAKIQDGLVDEMSTIPLTVEGR